MILGGGPGIDLYPLTKFRAEPAVPFVSLYRLVDIPVSNLINSGVTQIYVLAQYNSTSLNRHLSRTYGFVSGVSFGSVEGFVEPLNATQTPTQRKWFQGTADAVRHYSYLLNDETKHEECEDVIIMMGDQLYRMDFAQLLNYHRHKNADVTIATTPCDEEHATHLGVLAVDENMRVQQFAEKPSRSVLTTMSMDTSFYGLDQSDAASKPFVANMGIYIFKKAVLVDLLNNAFPDALDFSREILPYVVNNLNIQAFPFTSYWEDVGTLKNYFNANLALAKDTTKIELFDKDNPIFTEARMLPPTKVYNSEINQSLVGDGCLIQDAKIEGSVIGSCTYISPGAHVEDSILFGADHYETTAMRATDAAGGEVLTGVGAGSVLRNCIVDKNARIGANVRITNEAGVQSAEDEDQGYCIKDGIVVVMRGAVIADGTVI